MLRKLKLIKMRIQNKQIKAYILMVKALLQASYFCAKETITHPCQDSICYDVTLRPIEHPLQRPEYILTKNTSTGAARLFARDEDTELYCAVIFNLLDQKKADRLLGKLYQLEKVERDLMLQSMIDDSTHKKWFSLK